jgi:hypothetical protein
MKQTSTSKRRHVHLGERLEVIERIRAGQTNPEEAAEEIGVSAEQVHVWMQIHADERIVALDDTRISPEVRRLSRRAELLVELIASEELTIRILSRMLAEGAGIRAPVHQD